MTVQGHAGLRGDTLTAGDTFGGDAQESTPVHPRAVRVDHLDCDPPTEFKQVQANLFLVLGLGWGFRPYSYFGAHC